MSILNKNISYFPSINATKEGRIIPLLTVLQSEKHKSIITTLRNEAEPFKQKQLKLQLPCYTVAGIFGSRANRNLVNVSGLAAVDLDSVEDYDPIQVMLELKKIPYIAYCGLSCRGKRLFCIVPFLYPDQYFRQYNMLIKAFEAIDLPMGDNCHKIISQPRFVSYNTDATQFFNHEAKKFHLIEPERKYYNVPTYSTNQIHNPAKAFQWCVSQINKKLSFAENTRHEYILQLARYCNLKGMEERETLDRCLNFKENGFDENEITKVVKHIYVSHKNSFNKFPFSV